jgi:hypothetical protein
MPSNVQIDETLKYVIDNSPVDKSKLSSEGQKLIQDIREIVETARLIVQEKNADELFQVRRPCLLSFGCLRRANACFRRTLSGILVMLMCRVSKETPVTVFPSIRARSRMTDS